MDVQSVITHLPNPNVQEFSPGDTVKVSFRVREGERERVQMFQGVVIRRRGGGAGATFTVRRVTHGVGAERVFPLYSPLLEGVEVVRFGIVRRAKLYYLRGLRGRAARIKERQRFGVRSSPQPAPKPAEELEPEPAEVMEPEPEGVLELEPAEELEQQPEGEPDQAR